MPNFYKLIKYIRPYLLSAGLNAVFNIFAVIFSVVSLTMVIPFLRLLFGTQELIVNKPELKFSVDSLVDLFYFHLSSIIITEGKVNTLFFICILVTILFFLKNLFRYLALYFLATVRNKVVRDLRNQIFKKVILLPLSFFSNKKKGDLIARMTSDVQEIEWFVMSSLEVAFRDPVSIILFLFAMLMMSPQLTLFVIVLLPITGFIIGKMGNSLKKYAVHGQEKMGEVLSIIEETISGIRIIKAFNAQSSVQKRFEKENLKHSELLIKMYRKREMSSPLTEFLGAVVLVVVMWFGGKMVLAGEGIDAAMFIGFIALFSQIIPPAKSFATAYYNIKKGMASYDRIEKILESDVRILEISNPVPITVFKNSIEYRNVTFLYDEKTNNQILKNINLKINKGETIALVGPSGGGKTTLADLLPRFYDTVKGDIFIDGTSVKNYKLNELRQLMGIVTQESILFNDSIFNNIAFGSQATAEEVINAATIANAHDFISILKYGYETNIGDRGNKLSGGQRQRIAIARAVLKNPSILILDEATSSLDIESEKLVQDALFRLMENRTSIVIAHRLSTIQKANRIVVIDKGEIVQEGKHTDLIKSEGVYKRLHELQVFD